MCYMSTFLFINLLWVSLMKEASIMICTKYKDDDNNNHNDNSIASKLCIIFLSRPKHFPLSYHCNWSLLRSIIRVLPLRLHKAGSRNQDIWIPWPNRFPSFKFVCFICFLDWALRIPDYPPDLGRKTGSYSL